ncbi:MAG TPA: tyrosine-type recombinase/integrase, partial [Sediminibacterium sp.]
MTSTHTFAVDIIIRRNKADKEKALIYARITVDGDAREISLKESIAVAEWDSKTETVTGKSVRVKYINNVICETRQHIKDKYRWMRCEEMDITAESLKQFYLGEAIAQKGKQLFDLLDYFTRIFGAKLKQGGFKNYKTTIAYVKAFASQHFGGKTVYLKQVDMQFATDLEHYIRTQPLKDFDPCLGNGVAKHIQRFKRIMNWAAEIKWVKVNEIDPYKCPLKKSRRKKLTMEEVLQLESKHFQDENLNYVRDLFIFSCYTSFAYIDVITLTEEDFEFEMDGKIWCLKYRVKSEELQRVLMLKSATRILHRYRGREKSAETKAIFPFLTNQYVNRCLHIIQNACEITTPITFHVARHTFAKTVALKNGVPMETIQKIMGHTKITTTQIYADVDEEKIIDDFSKLEERLD